MSSGNPLINIGELSKPATLLVQKVSDAIGGAFQPYQIIRVAKAEAEAEVIRAKSQIEITDLQKRAMHRFLEEEAKKQMNIEEITRKALPELEDKSRPDQVADDWITNFFDKCRIVSDNDMQVLWSKVLAGEANSPGAFSKKTVNLLGDLDKRDAELFTKLCGFAWVIGDIVPVVFDCTDKIYNNNGINFNGLIHLESLGLIQFDCLAGFIRVRLPQGLTVTYYKRSLQLTLAQATDNQLELGQVLLTRAGEELAPICGARPVDGFFDFVYDKWAAQSFAPKRETEPGAPAEVGGGP